MLQTLLLLNCQSCGRQLSWPQLCHTHNSGQVTCRLPSGGCAHTTKCFCSFRKRPHFQIENVLKEACLPEPSSDHAMPTAAGAALNG